MELANVGVIPGARFGVPLPQASLLLEPGGALRLFNPVAGETVRLGLAASGLATVLGFANHAAARVAVTVGGVAGSLPADLVASARLAPGTALTGFLSPTDFGPQQAVRVTAVSLDGTDHLIATRPAGAGFDLFRIAPDQSLQRTASIADTPETAASGIAAFALVTQGTGAVLYAGSATEHGITAYRLQDGLVTAIDTEGPAQGVPMQGVTCLATVEAGGARWLIAGAAGSSSLTVFAIAADGSLRATDHVIDDLATRFDGVMALDAITVGGRVFVVAAGADDGISFSTLLPGGTLLHLSTLADSTAMALADVTALRLALVGGLLQVMAVSGAEAGLSQLSVDLRALGLTGGTGSAGDDLLTAAPGGGALSGGAGRDILLDGAGSDTLTGGAGADIFVLTVDGQRDLITDFDPAQDRIDLTHWTFFRNSGQLAITSTATGAILRFGGEELELRSADGRSLTEATLRALTYGATTRLAPEGTPVVIIPPPPDPITGSAGNDLLLGTAGADAINGLGGDDTLQGGGGGDTLTGGAGRDWASYAVFGTGLRFDLGRWANSSPEIARDLLDGIEGIIGTGFADRMTGFKSPVLFDGGSGNDTLTSGDRGGELYGGAGDDSLTGGAGAETLSGGTGSDTLTALEGDDSLDGGIGNDRLFGGLGADRLTGGDGDDWLEGGDGLDTLTDGAGNDTLYGGAGNETLTASAGDDWLYGDEGDDSLDGGIGNDRLFGGLGADRLTGGDGDDWLEGGEGLDTLTDGAGNDTLYGGAGNETIAATAGDDWLYGDEGDDSLDGGIGNDRLFGGLGADRLTGGDGDDWLEGGDGLDTLTDGAGNDTLYGGAGNETITATAGDDWLHGDEGDDSLDGGIGNDRLFGGLGADRLTGGDGDDWLEGGEGLDTLSDGAGNDTLYGGAGNETITATAGNDWLFGDEGDDSLDGGANNDRLFGGAGADLVSGGIGDDSLSGGAGNDRLSGLAGRDSLDGGEGDDLLNGGSGDDSLSGGAGNDRLSASTGNDWLDGGEGDDLLSGLFGADRLSGGEGRDTLEGGLGNDTLTGGAGADVFLFARPGQGEIDLITDFEDGIDRLRLIGIAGSTDAARFASLTLREVTLGGTDYLEVIRPGQTIRIEGLQKTDLGPADFLFL